LFGLPEFWLASVSRLGAASAESYGRDRFRKIAGFGQHWFGTSAEIATIKLNEIEGRLQESLTGYFASNECSVHTGSS
jgi:hypothetical protein